MLAAGALPWLAGCGRDPEPDWQARWVGQSHERGHRLRAAAESRLAPATGAARRCSVLIVGGGVAGLAAARGFMQQGVDDVHLLELEDAAGGNSRGHVMQGLACPMGAHYLPLPGPDAPEVEELLLELGLARRVLGRTVYDEQHLSHSPQERLFFDGGWVEGVLPPAEPGSDTLAQYRRFAGEVTQAQRALGFAMPSQRAPWTAGHAELDRLSFDAWLAARGLVDARLRWYLDYCCRDDYGAGSATVSAWAGLHYFGSRHGFHAPGDADAAAEPVLTWPQGNAWLTDRLAAPLADRLHVGRTVLRVDEQRHGVEVHAHVAATDRSERWWADTVVLAIAPFVARHVVESPGPALRQAAALVQHSPWLVANLRLDRPPLARPGAPASWDNVVYGSPALGYVDAGHQSLRADRRSTVLTFYEPWSAARRADLLGLGARDAAVHVLDILKGVHPDLERRVQQIDLVRHGHAMAIPRPGVRSDAADGALAALRRQRGRVRHAHADLAGYSVFEEAFTLGLGVSRPPK